MRFVRKAVISSHIALCQTVYRSASENAKSSEEGECSTRVEVEVVAAEATRFAIFGYRGLRVIGCLLRAGGDVGEDGGNEETCGN